MDGKDSGLLCGVVGLQADIGGAVAIGLHVFVDLVLNHRPKHSAILHIPVYQTMAEDHAHKSVDECHPYREFEGMQSSI